MTIQIADTSGNLDEKQLEMEFSPILQAYIIKHYRR
jgi:hypothetical protein